MLTSEVDVFRSTLSNSVQSHKKIDKFQNSNAKSIQNNLFTSKSSKRIVCETASSIDLQKIKLPSVNRNQVSLSNFRGVTSSLKDMKKGHNVSFYNPHVFQLQADFDTSSSAVSISKRLPLKQHRGSIFESFNQKLVQNQNPRTLLEDAGVRGRPNEISKLTVAAKKNVV